MQNDELADFIGRTKYFQPGENFDGMVDRIAGALHDDELHRRQLKSILKRRAFIPAGRILASIGSPRLTTAFNCYVSRPIEDSMRGIHAALGEALDTLRMGGGIGYDFSTLRPCGDRIASLDSDSSGPVGNGVRKSGFMDLFDAACSVISSAGHRRGAQMGVLRVDHPDIPHFIRAKRQAGRLTNFNVSVGVTDKFMHAVIGGYRFPLVFNDKVYEWVDARALWDEIMRSTWDYAEPGVLFLDTMNKKNNLRYCETIAATNPCGEQPLPPYGACLLGSFNLVAYIVGDESGGLYFNYEQLKNDITVVVRAMDNVIDRTIYPLKEQEHEAKAKRRMGLGLTGLANAAEILGFPYATPDMLAFTKKVLTTIRDGSYQTSVSLAIEKGSFPAFNPEGYLAEGTFASGLPDEIKGLIREFGIRNSHLLSIAPTGTISLFAGNVSSGCEPPIRSGVYSRNVYAPDGSVVSFDIQDYAELHAGVVGRSAEDITAEDHVDVLTLCSRYVDSSVSKTCNVGDNVSFTDFKNIYLRAWMDDASGCTTFREAGFRKGIVSQQSEGEVDEVKEGAACTFNPDGTRTCD